MLFLPILTYVPQLPSYHETNQATYGFVDKLACSIDDDRTNNCFHPSFKQVYKNHIPSSVIISVKSIQDKSILESCWMLKKGRRIQFGMFSDFSASSLCRIYGINDADTVGLPSDIFITQAFMGLNLNCQRLVVKIGYEADNYSSASLNNYNIVLQGLTFSMAYGF